MLSELAKKRLEICKQCPLFKETKNGAVCDSNKYISPDGKEWSYFKKDGYKQGCNCNLNWKTNNLSNHCIINLW